MYDRWTRLTDAGSGELGYRHAASPIAAVVMLLLGASCFGGVFWKIATDWPDAWQTIATGMFFGIAFLLAAQQAATIRETWFARTPLRVTFVRNLLGWRRARVQHLEANGVVTCEQRVEPTESDATLSYQVLLVSPSSPAEPIFIHSYHEHDEPAAIAREIADCLRWSFEDRSLASAGRTSSLSSYVLSRKGLASVARAAEKLSKVGVAATALGMMVQALIYFAGLSNAAMTLGWFVAFLVFLAMRFAFSFAQRRFPRTVDATEA